MLAQYNKQGYCILRHVFAKAQIESLQATILAGIQDCIDDLKTTEAIYLSAVNRWRAPSPVTREITQPMIDQLSMAIEPIIGPGAVHSKTNVILKNQYANGPIPCHQDLSYNKDQPYQLSCWLAVSDVTQADGAVYLYPQSHLLPLQGAIDFWSPDHQDGLPPLLASLRAPALTITLQRGDVLLFDSRLWHGSYANTSGRHRIAVVTRWTGKDYELPAPIPDPAPHFFGMWTCFEQTITILSQALKSFYQEEVTDFLQLIDVWQQKVLDNDTDGGLGPTKELYTVLERLKILQLASSQHNGGDSYGRVYKAIWTYLLAPLQQKMRTNG